jgi:hypothetical protein
MTIPPLTGNQKWLNLGDSITYGQNDPALNGFRKKRNAALDADRIAGAIPSSLTFTYVGSTTSGDAPTDHHRGVPGWTLPDQIADAPTQYGVGNPVPVVNICSIFMGMNDANSDALVNAYTTNYLTLVGLINSLAGCTHFIGNLIQYPTDAIQSKLDRIARLNAQLPGIWNTMQGMGLYVARTNLCVSTLPTHPDATGFDVFVAGYRAPDRAILGYPIAA